LVDRRRSDTVVVSTVNNVNQGLKEDNKFIIITCSKNTGEK
jgi:hypothetical protein